MSIACVLICQVLKREDGRVSCGMRCTAKWICPVYLIKMREVENGLLNQAVAKWRKVQKSCAHCLIAGDLSTSGLVSTLVVLSLGLLFRFFFVPRRLFPFRKRPFTSLPSPSSFVSSYPSRLLRNLFIESLVLKLRLLLWFLHPSSPRSFAPLAVSSSRSFAPLQASPGPYPVS